MQKIDLDLLDTIPTTDPQDPGFDVEINYVATRDPTSSEPLIYNDLPFLMLLWQNASSSDAWETYATNDFFMCANNTADSQVWWRMVFDANILAILFAAGWQINTPRGYSDQSSLGFNISRQPSATNDVSLSCSVTLANTLLTTATVEIQISLDNSTFITICTLANLTEEVNSSTYSTNLTIPSGYYYQLTTSGSGTHTLVNLQELIL